jgi:hypothetical protein
VSIMIGTPNAGVNHRFDAGQVGAGREHPNVTPVAPTDPVNIKELQVAVSLVASATDPELPVTENPAFEEVMCIVDTGAQPSLFQAEVAIALNLDPNGGDINRDGVVGIGSALACTLCIHEIYLDIGPEAIPVRVQFPVEKVYAGATSKYRWLGGVLNENILGMESVLNKRLLCFTPETLYAFEMKRGGGTDTR